VQGGEEVPDWGVWVIIAIVFAVVEMATTEFFSLFFALGGLVTALLAVVTEDWVLQTVVFIVASVIFTWRLRPILLRSYLSNEVKTNVARQAGRVGIVVQEINNLEAQGQVKVDGELWTARSESGETIAAGQRVEVVRIEGVKAIVRTKEE
jgi:membrane protein implicated in regulation of membrane protease activity